MSSLVLLWVLAEAVLISAQNPSPPPRVTVADGVLVGETVTFTESRYINITKDVDRFLGVPFADPPVRFAPPEPKTPWTGSLVVRQYKPACIQGDNPRYTYGSSEDCLYLNVFAPNPKPSGAAVMVWIHGGLFWVGSSNYDGASGIPLVATGDVIVVTINYRVGVFSQLTTKDEFAPGNIGMLDQVAALKWIHENIEAFGGDRNRVTLFGNSAGGASAGFHLLSKLSRNYFSQVIFQSGTAFSVWAFSNNPEKERRDAFELGMELGCPGTNDSAILVACLRTKDAESLRVAGDLQVWPRSWYKINVDGNFLEDTPENLYRRGDVKHASIMSGVAAEEGTLAVLEFAYVDYFASQAPPVINRQALGDIVEQMLAYVGIDDDVPAAAVMEEYVDWSVADDPSADLFRSAVDACGDFFYHQDHDRVIRAHAELNDTVFSYYFTHVPSSTYDYYLGGTLWLGATHGEELQFMFGFPFIDSLSSIPAPLTAEEYAFSVQLMNFWTNFAKSGDPSKPDRGAEPGEGVQAWPAFTIPELRHKELSLELGVLRAVRAARSHFWNEYFPDLAKFARNIDDDVRDWKTSFDDWREDISDWIHAFDKYTAGINRRN